MNSVKRLVAWYNRPKSTFLQYVEALIVLLPIAFVIRTFFYGLYQVPTGSMEVTMLVGERFFADKFTIFFKPPKRGEIIAFNDPNFPYSETYAKKLFEQYVWGPSNWTKRVIGLPGEHVVGKMEEGKPVVYINDKRLDEPYVNPNPLLGIYQDRGRGDIEMRSWARQEPFHQQPFYSMTEYEANLAARMARVYPDRLIAEPYTPTYDRDGRNIDEYDIQLAADEYWVMGDNRKNSYDSRNWGPLKREFIHGKIVFRIMSIDSRDSWLILDLLRHPIEFWSRVRWSRFFQWVH